MWISTIELTQFKSYSHAEFVFPEPDGERNIAVIGGLNGYGKTTILEALYLCLYGKDALPYLARAGLKIDDYRGYPTFLERALNGEARREGEDMMSVRVVLHRTRTKAVDIRRRWFFRANGQWHDEEAVVRDVNRDAPGSPRTDGKNGFYLSELLEQQFIPAHIAPFFFFDGEEVKKLADQSRIEQVKQGLEGLLGVVLLRSLAERLKGFEAAKRQNISSVDESNIDRMLAELTADEDKLKEIREDSARSNERLSAAKSERTSLIERITGAGGGGGAIASVADLVEERTQLGNDLKGVQRKLEKILGEKLPFHLMPSSLLTSFRTQLQEEIALEQWETERRALEPKREKFASAFLGAEKPDFRPPLSAEQIAAVRARIETAWASLFHPRPDSCARTIRHPYLGAEVRRKALGFLDTISVGQQEVHTLLNEQRRLQDRIEELRRRIARLEGVDRDGTLTELTRSLNKVTAEIDDLEVHIRDEARKIAGLEVTVNQVRARYEQERQRADATSPIRQLIEKSERVRRVIEDVIPSLFPLKVKQLSTAMTRVYKQLAHKTQVDKIVIENDGTTHVLSPNDKELPFDRSAGENQIFATALIAGLAEVSGVLAPLVVDTPLGRLDSKHRENIFRFWTSDPSRQVILLSQDEEIGPDFYKRIKRNVAVTYLLEHTDVGDGIGRTVARKGKYFGGYRMSDLDIQTVLSLRYRTSQEADRYTDQLRQQLALETKAQVARLAIGRSLNMGPFHGLSTDSKGLDIPAQSLFTPENAGAWVGLIVTHSLFNDGQPIDSLESLRASIRLHWHRGVLELWRDFIESEENYDKFMETLVARRSEMPENAVSHDEDGGAQPGMPGPATDQSHALIKALGELGIHIQVKDVLHGPRLTRYRVLLTNLVDSSKIDRVLPQLALALNLGQKVPVKTNGDEARTVFIDLPRPRESWSTVPFEKITEWAARAPRDVTKLLLYAGVSVTADDIVLDLATAPHLFVGGTTNSGKSVCLHSLIASLLLTHTPDTLQLALIDPKRVEFSRYAKLPNLYRGAMATETSQAREMLQDLVAEMDARYASFERIGVANIADARRRGHQLPFIVAVVEEMSALVHGDKNIQPLIERLAEKARAAGIHLILATQRPDAVTFTGLLRSNIPARIAMSVQKGTESKIILDEAGAENLLGAGDMLIKLPGELLTRAHGVFLRPEQVVSVLSKRT